MPIRMRPFALLGLVGLLAACQSLVVEAPTDFEALQDASDAYLAYERGDCKTASRLSDPKRLAAWEPTEVLHSMLLLNAFCKEQAGDMDEAREIYDQLIQEAPKSFAARDAKERSRILRIQESDPNHSAWMRDARDRAMQAQASPTQRVPVERRNALFPPIARTTGIDGYAVVEFGVTPRGSTTDPIVIESKPPLLFEGTSLRAIRDWEYTRRTTATSNDFQVIRLVFQVSGREPQAVEVETMESTVDPKTDPKTDPMTDPEVAPEDPES